MANIGKNGMDELLSAILSSHQHLFCIHERICTPEQFVSFGDHVKAKASVLKSRKMNRTERLKMWTSHVKRQAEAVNNTKTTKHNEHMDNVNPYRDVNTQFLAAFGLRYNITLITKGSKGLEGGCAQWKCIKAVKDYQKLFRGKLPYIPEVNYRDAITKEHMDDVFQCNPVVLGFPPKYSNGNNLTKKYNNHMHIPACNVLKRDGIDFVYLFGTQEDWVKKTGTASRRGTKKKKISKNDHDNCKTGDVLYLDGSDTMLWGKCVYFVGAYQIVDGMKQNKVGYIKCLHLDLEMLTNRFVQVVGMNKDDGWKVDQMKNLGGMLRLKFIEL